MKVENEEGSMEEEGVIFLHNQESHEILVTFSSLFSVSFFCYVNRVSSPSLFCYPFSFLLSCCWKFVRLFEIGSVRKSVRNQLEKLVIWLGLFWGMLEILFDS